MIPLSRRLEYAAGYLALGLLDEASDELEMIQGDDRLSAEVMRLRVDLYQQAKEWDLLLAVAKALARLDPEDEQGWISWALTSKPLYLPTARQLGAQCALAKPIRHDVLLEAVTAVLAEPAPPTVPRPGPDGGAGPGTARRTREP